MLATPLISRGASSYLVDDKPLALTRDKGQNRVQDPLPGVRMINQVIDFWCTQHDSNVRPLPSEGNALSS